MEYPITVTIVVLAFVAFSIYIIKYAKTDAPTD